ncbi:MAG: FHA domain-containing protein [Chloroflexota bacterium]
MDVDSDFFDDDFILEEPINTGELLLVSFYLPNRPEPVAISGMKTITIGRRDPKRRINPTIDLTEDNGAKLGVSRLHAEMNFVNDHFVVKDTGSANGTWVNDNRLQPYQAQTVKSGDQLRIGQIVIRLHIALPARFESSSVDTVVTAIGTQTGNAKPYEIVDNTGGILVEHDALVISKLRSVSTFLERISRVHGIIREAQQKESDAFSVLSIRISNAQTLLVDVGEGDDVMDFMAKKLGPFLSVLEGRVKGNSKQTDSLQRYSEPLEQIADYALQELVFRFLKESRDDYVRRLAPHFDAILGVDLSVQPVITAG